MGEQGSVWIIEYEEGGTWHRSSALLFLDTLKYAETKLPRLKKQYPNVKYRISEYRRVEEEKK